MTNGWKSVWEKNKVMERITLYGSESASEIFYELKSFTDPSYRGGDFLPEIYKRLTDQFEEIIREFSFSKDPEYCPASFFDVGCATGAYLYYLLHTRKNVRVGGVDYSEPYIETARRFIPEAAELYCSEAGNMATDIKYDCVYSRSIFQYFESVEYGRKVVGLMIEKANHSVGILDVHDLAKRDAFLAYRRATVENYDEKYKDTQHLFYPKSMFIEIAEEFDCDVKFAHCTLPEYWNAPFTYDVYFYKRQN